MLLRDLTVLRKTLNEFLPRTVLQPFLLVFVFTYVFPKIGQRVGATAGAAASFSSLLVPGVVAIACMFQGIQSVAIPLVQEFSFSREIEDRVMAPLPVWAVAMEKIVAGAIQGLLAGLVVFPLAALIPSTPVHLDIRWAVLIPTLLLASLLGASLGLAVGTRVNPRQITLVFGLIVIPITFLGATYYPWASLTPIPWLKWLVLANPLVYMSEAFRISLTPQIPHMPLAAAMGALFGFTLLLGWFGVRWFARRVQT